MTTFQKIAKWYANYCEDEFRKPRKLAIEAIRENPSNVGLCYTTYEDEDASGNWHEGDIQVSMNLVDPSASIEVYWDGDEQWHKKVEKYDTLEDLFADLIGVDGFYSSWDDYYSWAMDFVWEFLDGKAV
jgi:hypothetical protein